MADHFALDLAQIDIVDKGFAVVASEVKALATQTSRATGDIEAHIAAIQSATAGAVSTVDTIAQTIRRTSDITTMIAAAVEEQTSVTTEISRAVTQAAAGVN